MSAICGPAIKLCAVRVTRLDSLGNPSPGPNNVYITDKAMMIAAKPVIEAGSDNTLLGGCDCIIATRRGTDKLKRFDLELDLGVLEPGLFEMMLGAPAILDGSGFPIGVHWPNQLSCSDPQQPNVCFEGWQDLWEDDHQASSPYPYVHWVWPSTSWTLSDLSLQNDFNQPKFTGYSRGNPNWGLGLFSDTPEHVGPLGDFFYCATIPVGACGYGTHNLT